MSIYNKIQQCMAPRVLYIDNDKHSNMMTYRLW